MRVLYQRPFSDIGVIAQKNYSRLRSRGGNDIIPRMNNPLHPGGTIALLNDPVYQALREKISGVYAAATRCSWQVFLTKERPTAAVVRKIKSMINPIGFIIDPLLMPSPIDRKWFGDTPVVLLGRDNHRTAQIFDCSRQDVVQPVAAAIDVFREFGRFASLGFIGHPSRESWSIERGAIFAERIFGMAPVFEYSGQDADSSKGNSHLVKWLRSLPKPCGLFLATDHLAPAAFGAIHRAGITVPGEMAVASVDDIHEICQNVIPTLTSVKLNYFQCGMNAVELLEKRLREPDRPAETMLYGVVAVSKRASTRKPYTDKRVAKAVEFITDNITSAISSVHVVKAMGCGRRQAEQLFKKHTGLSILNAIQKIRIEKAVSLLKDGRIPTKEIPSLCGYGSAAFFHTIFRRETGMSMREFRMQGRHR